MIKYDVCRVVFQEIPTEVSLAFTITGCKNKCIECHSAHLRENIGELLTREILLEKIKLNKYITCVLFLGGDHEENELLKLIKIVKEQGLKVALYSGKNEVSDNLILELSYLKLGGYDSFYGPLTSKTTNQRLYYLDTDEDITYKFWK